MTIKICSDSYYVKFQAYRFFPTAGIDELPKTRKARIAGFAESASSTAEKVN